MCELIWWWTYCFGHYTLFAVSHAPLSDTIFFNAQDWSILIFNTMPIWYSKIFLASLGVPKLPQICVFGLKIHKNKWISSILDIEDSILHDIVTTIRLSRSRYIIDRYSHPWSVVTCAYLCKGSNRKKMEFFLMEFSMKGGLSSSIILFLNWLLKNI